MISARPPNGIYECLILKMSDTFQFKPAATAGTCIAGTTYFYDTYTAGSNYRDADGVAITAHDYSATQIEDAIYLYITNGAPSQGPAGAQVFALAGGTIDTNGGAQREIVYYADFNGQINGGGGACTMNAGSIGFRVP